MPSSRSATAAGIDELPTLMESPQQPNHAASICLAFYAGVGQRLVEGFGHQLGRACVPALAELGTACAEDGDLVLDTGCHDQAFPPAKAGTAFQKYRL